jgi:hypothetical protein
MWGCMKEKIQVGDIVYSMDEIIKDNCPDLYGKPAIVWEIHKNEARLRFFDFGYYYEGSYHGVRLSTCKKVPKVIELLVCE